MAISGKSELRSPPGAVPASLARHILNPEGEGTIYLCRVDSCSGVPRLAPPLDWEPRPLPGDEPARDLCSAAATG
jgi:hypothetical protein